MLELVGNPEDSFSNGAAHIECMHCCTGVSYEDYREMVRGRIQISWKRHGCECFLIHMQITLKRFAIVEKKLCYTDLKIMSRWMG